MRRWLSAPFFCLVPWLVTCLFVGLLPVDSIHALPVASGVGQARPTEPCESQLPGALGLNIRPLTDIAEAVQPSPRDLDQSEGDMLPVGNVAEYANRAGRRIFTSAELASAPLRAVGRLDVSDRNQVGTCTATMISRCVALTAAHCLTGFDPQRSEGVFRFADGSQSARVTEARSHPQYGRLSGFANSQYDVAIVRLDRPIGQGRALPVVWVDPSNLRQVEWAQRNAERRVIAPGYHRDLAQGQRIPLSGSLDASFNLIDLRGITHSADTFSGGSGGPLLAPCPQSEGQCIFGVNVTTALTRDGRQVRVNTLTTENASFGSLPHYFRREIESAMAQECSTAN